MSGDIHSQIISELWALTRKRLFPQNNILIHWSHTNTTLRLKNKERKKINTITNGPSVPVVVLRLTFKAGY